MKERRRENASHLLIHSFTKHVLSRAALGILGLDREHRSGLHVPQERCSVLYSIRCDTHEH